MTTLDSNVYALPEGGRSASPAYDPALLLTESRNHVALKLRETLRTALATLSEALLEKGDLCETTEQRNFCYDSSTLLKNNADRLEALVASQWSTAFDLVSGAGQKRPQLAVVADGSDLQLVDPTVIDEDIAVANLVQALRNADTDGVYAASRRLAFLIGPEEANFPLEDTLAHALDKAFVQAELDCPLRLELLHALAQQHLPLLTAIIHELNAFLIGRHVLPKLRRSYNRPRTDKPDSATASGATPNNQDIFALLQKLANQVGAGNSSSASSANHVSAFVSTSLPTALPMGLQANPMNSANPADGVLMSAAAVATVAALTQAMNTLDSLQRAAPSDASGYSADTLRHFRNSQAGQNLGPLDAVTVDIVTTLFDFIFDDPAIPDPIKALVARLQIPVLKVAMLDKAFFSSKSHPARRLLDGISRAAVRCGANIGRDDPLYTQLSTIIEHLQANFAQDTRLFDQLCAQLDAFLAEQESHADGRAAQVAPFLSEHERRAMAETATSQALAPWLNKGLPACVVDLLDHEWRAKLTQHYLSGDGDGWDQAVALIAELAESVSPQPNGAARKQLASRLPAMVRKIHQGLNQLHVSDDRRLGLINNFFTIHAAILRGTDLPQTKAAPPAAKLPPYWPTPKPVPGAVIGEVAGSGNGSSITGNAAVADDMAKPDTGDEGEISVWQDLSLFEAEATNPQEQDSSGNQQRVDELRRGDWLEFIDPSDTEARALRYRLSWISPERGILLFTSPHTPKAVAISPVALASRIDQGGARFIDVEPIFERAVNRALASLKAA